MSTSTESGDGIEQVREILVGAVQRELERKLVRLEAHLSTRVGELGQETRRRTDVIEAHLRREIEALSLRLDRELTDVKEGLRALARDRRETEAVIEDRTSKLEEALARAEQELRTQILDQAKSFLDELQRTRADLTQTLEHELDAFDLGAAAAEEPKRRDHDVAESPVP